MPIVFKYEPNSYYHVSYKDGGQLITEYLHTGESYQDQFGHRGVTLKEGYTITSDADTQEVEDVSETHELWEPAVFLKFEEISPMEYKLAVEHCEYLIHELHRSRGLRR